MTLCESLIAKCNTTDGREQAHKYILSIYEVLGGRNMDCDDRGIQPGKHIEDQTICESENLPQYDVIIRHHRPVTAIDRGKKPRSLVEANSGCNLLSISITW